MTEPSTGPFLPGHVAVPAQRSSSPRTASPRTASPRSASPACTPLAIPAQRAPIAPVRLPHPAQPPLVKDLARSEILHRHARLTKAGRPVFCTPSQDEMAGVVALRQGRGTDGKVIYPTREAAEAAARELEALGSRVLRSYRCGRSRSGHFHLTTDTAARIPAQRRPLSA